MPDDYDEPRLQREIDDVLRGSGFWGIPLPVRSEGVKADLRSYEHPALLSGHFPGWERLTQIATTLTKQVRGLNRCLYDLSGHAPEVARLVPATVTRRRLDLLRELDAIVMSASSDTTCATFGSARQCSSP